MNKAIKILKDNSLNKLFPNVSTAAYYNPFGQHIVLNSIDEIEYTNAMKDFHNPKHLKTIKLLVHELRHWKDHHTTIWGLKSQVDIYNAINARLLNQVEKFNYIVIFFKNAKISDSTEYYHTKLKSFDVKKNRIKWKWNLSVGARFDTDGLIDFSKPIQFVRFLNPNTNELLSRTPLSNSSFLETNAIAEEIKVMRSIYNKLDTETLIVETKLIESEYLDWLYNHEFTLYSVSAHLVSSILNQTDLIASFEISNLISNLILNLPDGLYDNIPINSYLDEFKERNNLLKSQKDNGFIFLNLLLNYSDKFKDTVKFDIEDLLKASNLPSSQEVEHLILDEFTQMKKKVIDGPFSKKVIEKIENAIEYFTKTGLHGASMPVFDYFEYETPTIIFGDTMIDEDIYNYEEFKKLVMNNVKLTNTGWYLMQHDIYKELETFYNICGI